MNYTSGLTFDLFLDAIVKDTNHIMDIKARTVVVTKRVVTLLGVDYDYDDIKWAWEEASIWWLAGGELEKQLDDPRFGIEAMLKLGVFEKVLDLNWCIESGENYDRFGKFLETVQGMTGSISWEIMFPFDSA